MDLVEWKNEFLLGVDSVDHEHRELIELINELYRSYCDQGSKLTVLDFLGELSLKISAHFALEEKIMQEYKYDEFESHKADHEQLLDDIGNIMEEYNEDKIFDEIIFGERLKDWFVEHFRTKDARLHGVLG